MEQPVEHLGGQGVALVADAAGLWTQCMAVVRAEVPDAVWQSTFGDVRAVARNEGQLVLSVPNRLVAERLEGRYRDLLQRALARCGASELTVRVRIEPPPATAPSAEELFPEPELAPSPHRVADPSPPATAAAPNGIRLNPRYTFDTFVIGESNRFAHAAALSVAERPAGSYNPLFIYGGVGLGKTHLLHAIGHYVCQNYPDRHVRYVTTEAFTNEFIDAIRTNTQAEFKRRYRACDVLLVDDIQFLENKEGTQEEFFHTFNSLHESAAQIVITSDRPPKSIATLEDRLRTRFEWGLVTDVLPPDLETRIAILRRKAEADQLVVPDDVCEFIATHITDNIRELEGALIRVSAYANLVQEPVTLALAQHALTDLLRANEPRPITPQAILEATAKQFGFTVDQLRDSSRRRPLVTARQVGMYVFRELTDFSYPAIAREFGKQDHTTVIHAVEKISRLMAEKRSIYDQVSELINRIKSGG